MRFGELYQEAKKSGVLQSLLPDGDFLIEVIGVNSGQTKAGDDKIGLQLKIVGLGGEERGELEEGDPAKDKISWFNLNFGDAAAAISVRQLKSFGLTDEFLDAAPDVSVVAEALKGVVLDVSVGHRHWGKNDENEANTLKVSEIVVPPVGIAVVEEEESY